MTTQKNKSFFLPIIITFIFCISTLIISQTSTPFNRDIQTVSYYGSRGQTVREIQVRLSNWGYYDGSIDGIFGYRTYRAVRLFQARNGLKVDGIVGTQTLSALGIQTGLQVTANASSNNYSRDARLLAHIISGEARGEPYLGQVAVGAVVLNRVRNSSFPNTIAGVIYQPGAFDAVSDGQINLTPAQSSIRAANDVLNGWDPSEGAIYYFNPATATNRWIWSRPFIKNIGKHRFCR